MPAENRTDEELVVAIRVRDKELYREIIQRYQGKVSHYLAKFIRDHDELEDVLQDVFIKTYRNLFAFNVKERFSPWIYRIAHNEAINHIKKYSKEAFSLDQAEWDAVDEKLDLKSEIDNTLMRSKVSESNAKLKEKYRAPLILYLFEEKSYQEISEILRVPVSTVGVMILRGKKQLREFLTAKT